MLQHAGGSHIARVRTAWDNGSFTTLQADSGGALVLLAGILLLIPGFITDIVGLLLLLSPLRQLAGRFGRGRRPNAPTAWSICRRKIGTRWPIRRYPTAATNERKG